MTLRTSRQGTAAILAVLFLWFAGTGVVAVGAIADRMGRQSGPEAAVNAYFSAVQSGDLGGALAQLEPSAREQSSSWVAWQLGNSYRVIESSVRGGSLLASIGERGEPGRSSVILVVEVSGKGNPAWQAVEEVPAVLDGGKWLLARPPLEGR